MHVMANPNERVPKQMPRCVQQALDACCESWTAFGEQLPVGCETLLDKGCLCMGRQATTWPELPVVKWVLPDPPSCEVREAKQRPPHKWKAYI